MKTETFTCQHCGTEFTRQRVRGTKPKWCSPACRSRGPYDRQRTSICERCGSPCHADATLCSRSCAGAKGAEASGRRPRKARRRAPAQLEIFNRRRFTEMRTPLRIAIESGDLQRVRQELRQRSTVNENGCWIWGGKLNRGYGEVRIAKRTLSTHRLAMGNPDGVVIHHACATPACCNPDHLHPVTPAENAAEMFERHTYRARITELEEVVRSFDPEHPTLGGSGSGHR